MRTLVFVIVVDELHVSVFLLHFLLVAQFLDCIYLLDDRPPGHRCGEIQQLSAGWSPPCRSRRFVGEGAGCVQFGDKGRAIFLGVERDAETHSCVRERKRQESAGLLRASRGGGAVDPRPS